MLTKTQARYVADILWNSIGIGADLNLQLPSTVEHGRIIIKSNGGTNSFSLEYRLGVFLLETARFNSLDDFRTAYGI